MMYQRFVSTIATIARAPRDANMQRHGTTPGRPRALETASAWVRSALHRAAAVFSVAALAGGAALALADDVDDAAKAVDPSKQSAAEVLQITTDRILAVIEDARAYVDEDPERYFAAVQEVLDPVVDFRGFARGVMGEYATTARYRSLDEAGRDKLREQLERFSATMRAGLVRTYSKGLLAFGGSRVELDEGASGGNDDRRATVKQLIYSDSGQPYVVIYQMARDRDGQWRMRNLIVENVNLGQIYRSQFEAAARRYEGDLDAVIDSWDAESLEES